MPNPNLPINFRKNTYIGARYVPKFADTPGSEWDNSIQYEPLTIVLYQGNSYTSKTFVPVGVDINNTTYWAETGNYNAQVEQYRQDVLKYISTTEQNIKDIKNMKAWYTPEMFGAIGDGVTDDSQALNSAGLAGNVMGTSGKTYLCTSDVTFAHSTFGINLMLNDNIVARFSGNSTFHYGNNFEVPLSEVEKHTGRGTFCTRTAASNIIFDSCNWHRGTNGLAITSSNGVKVINCYFNRMYQTGYEEGGNGYAIFLAQQASNVIIENCHMENIGRHFIYLSSDEDPITPLTNINIVNNIFDNRKINEQELPVQGKSTNIAINCRAGYNVIIRGNLAYLEDGFVGLIGANVENVLGSILIDGNEVHDTGNTNLVIRQAPTSNPVNDVRVSNNIFFSVLPVGSVNGMMDGNIFHTQTEGIRIYSTVPTDKLIVRNNMFLGQNAIGSGSTNATIDTLIFDSNYLQSTGSIGFIWRSGKIATVDFVNNVINSVTVATNKPIICDNVRYAINKSMVGKLTPCFEATTVDHEFENAFNFTS